MNNYFQFVVAFVRYEPGFGYYYDFNSNDGTTPINSVSSTTSQRQKRRRRILDKKREERTEEEEEKFRASEAIDRILLRLSKKNVLGKGSATKS